jgi:hypothetical protein
VINNQVQQELRPLNVLRRSFKVGTQGPSEVFQFNKDKDVEDTAVTAPLTDGNSLTNVELESLSEQATAAQAGIMATITDFLDAISIIPAVPHFSALMARTMNEKWEVDAAAVQGSYSQKTDNGTALTSSDFLEAVSALEARDVHGMLSAYLHVVQTGNLRTDITQNQTALYWANDRAAFNGVDVNSNGNGYAGSLFEVPIYRTSVIPISAADYQGVILEDGEAQGVYEKWNNKVELHRLPQAVATIVVLSSAYGFTIIDDDRGQGLYSESS